MTHEVADAFELFAMFGASGELDFVTGRGERFDPRPIVRRRDSGRSRRMGFVRSRFESTRRLRSWPVDGAFDRPAGGRDDNTR